MERNMDAGHSHLKTPHFVTDCPLCEAEKAVRNRAIEHLSEALHLLEGLRKPGDKPTIRLNLAPIGVTGDDVARCHSIDLTAKQAEDLADAIDSKNAYVGSESPIDGALRNLADGIKEAVVARPGGFVGEVIDSGEWSAAAVAQRTPEVAAVITDTFTSLDLVEITREILNEPQVNKLAVTQALDRWFGEIADPYADEDDD
jgi:hypothetical protein